MARINVELEALTDPRFAILGSFVGAPEGAAQAVGLYYAMRVWAYCTLQSIYHVPKAVLDAIHPRVGDGLIAAKLGKPSRTSIRIAGTKGRIEWLSKLRESNRIRQKSLRQRNALVTRDNPGALTPAPAPAPALLLQTPDCVPTERLSDSPQPANADAPIRVKVPKAPRNGRVKPSALVTPERLDELQAWYDKLYEFYPRHVGKQAGWKAFVAIEPTLEDCKQIAADIKRRVETREWEPTEPDRVRFIPHLSTYLNQRRWTDS